VVIRKSQFVEEIVRQASTRSSLWSVALIVLGMLGGALLLAGVSVNLVIAWLIALAGVLHLIIAHQAHRTGSVIWRVMIGFAYVGFGVYLIASPVLREASLALVLASLFLFEGIFDVAMSFRLRAIEGSRWVMVDGIVRLILGLIFYTQWPSATARAMGLFVSVSVVTSGLTRVMLSLAAGNAMAAGLGENRDDPAAKEYWEAHS
jgi:uncharacterized membrane protein HdeD (DUF308 family)